MERADTGQGPSVVCSPLAGGGGGGGPWSQYMFNNKWASPPGKGRASPLSPKPLQGFFLRPPPPPPFYVFLGPHLQHVEIPRLGI